MRALLAVAVAAVVLAVALALRAPATLVDGRIDALTGGRVRIANALGTVWSGSGDLILPSTDAGSHIAWRIDAWPLLHGELRGSLAQQDEPSGTFDLERDRYELDNLALALPADALARAIGAPGVLALVRGNVEVRVEHLAWKRDSVDGRAEIRWTAASLPGPRPDVRIALGDIRVACAGAGAELPGTIANTGGDVDIAGTVAFAAAGAARIDAHVRPREGLDDERARAITAALAAIGIPDGAGGYRVMTGYTP